MKSYNMDIGRERRETQMGTWRKREPSNQATCREDYGELFILPAIVPKEASSLAGKMYNRMAL